MGNRALNRRWPYVGRSGWTRANSKASQPKEVVIASGRCMVVVAFVRE
jgi:hypothetical protein